MPPEATEHPPAVPDAAAGVVGALQGLVDDQIALTTARATEQTTRLVVSVGLALGAGGIGLAAIIWLAAAATAGMALFLPLWAAFAIVGGTLLAFSLVPGVAAAYYSRRVLAAPPGGYDDE